MEWIVILTQDSVLPYSSSSLSVALLRHQLAMYIEGLLYCLGHKTFI
jgi:hypothetical protein